MLIGSGLFLIQLDANLIEGEPYNRLAQLKNKRQLKWRDKIQIYWKYGKLVFKAGQNKQCQWGPVQCYRYTVYFCAHPPTCGSKNVTR